MKISKESDFGKIAVFKKDTIDIMSLIASNYCVPTKTIIADYRDNRSMLSYLFDMTSNPYCKASIVLRLTAIDSFYSTNAEYSYFSIEEMAEKIISIGDEKAAADYFYDMVTSQVPCDIRGLFKEKYGIRKNLSEGSQQPSLLSKYAYYQVRKWREKYPLGFPIYDSLACEMYPVLASRLGKGRRNFLSSSEKDPETGSTDNNLEISMYIKALDDTRSVLFSSNNNLFQGYQQFDIQDALLWYMGKLNGGNLSLLMSRKDYTRFIKNLGINALPKTDNIFEERFSDYNRRMYEEYSSTFSNDRIVSKKISTTKDSITKVTYKADVNSMIHYKMTHSANSAFNGLDREEYFKTLLTYYIKYF